MENAGARGPSFRLLQVVAVADTEWAREARLAGQQGFVTQVRDYGLGRYRYAVCPLDDAEAVACIYDEADLVGLERSVSVDPLRSPGRFHMRDVVTVAANTEHAEIAGLEAEICGWDKTPAGVIYTVFVPARGEVWTSIRQEDLRATGRRVPTPERGSPATSSLVGPDGEPRGRESYVVLADLGDLL